MGVPSIRPPVSPTSACSDLASPKSVTLTVPSGSTMRLEGFTSLWTTPAPWAAASPRAAWTSTSRPRARGKGPSLFTASSRVEPGQCSIVK